MKFPKEPWEFGVLGIYNFNLPGKLETMFRHLETGQIEGDVAEFGVFRGSTLMSFAGFLREFSSKNVWGFDTFAGFPPESLHEKDSWSNFEEMFNSEQISAAHFARVQRNIELVRVRDGEMTSSGLTASSSGDFSKTSLNHVLRMVDALGLDNVRLVPGDFSATLAQVSRDYPDLRISAANLDADTYLGYKLPLSFLAMHMSPGGLVYLDEYYSLKFPGARIAISEFLEENEDFRLFVEEDVVDSTWERAYLVRDGVSA